MTARKKEERQRRARAMIRVLKRLFGESKTALRFGNIWELYVAVALSAQCTDKRVNEVTKTLFKKYPTFASYVTAARDSHSAARFAEDIKPTGFYRNKAKHILAAARMVDAEFGGTMPKTMEELLAIPGIGRKTANVILGNAYGIYDGIAVDTHVRRFSRRFDLSDYTDPIRIERDLLEVVPKQHWFQFTNWLIEYGREVCPARKHACAEHPLTKLYPSAAKRWPTAR